MHLNTASPARRSPAKRFARSAALVLLAALLGGCLEHDPAVPRSAASTEGAVRAFDFAPSGIEQEVRVEPRRVAPGDTLVIRSVVRNRGSVGVRLEARVCGLDVESPAPLVDPFPRCGGWVANRTLGAGHEIELVDRREVRETDGETLRLRVRHLVGPERWVELEIPVRR